jgi:hypothetical protein
VSNTNTAGKERQSDEGKLLTVARLSIIISKTSEENKTDFITPTTSADVAENEHYEHFFVSGRCLVQISGRRPLIEVVCSFTQSLQANAGILP